MKKISQTFSVLPLTLRWLWTNYLTGEGIKLHGKLFSDGCNISKEITETKNEVRDEKVCGYQRLREDINQKENSLLVVDFPEDGHMEEDGCCEEEESAVPGFKDEDSSFKDMYLHFPPQAGVIRFILFDRCRAAENKVFRSTRVFFSQKVWALGHPESGFNPRKSQKFRVLGPR